MLSSIRTLATAGSRRRPCWFKSGRRMYFSAPCCQEGTSEENFVALPTEGPGVLHRASLPVKLAGSIRIAGCRLRGGLLLSPLRVPRQEPGPVSRIRLLARGALCSPSEECRQEVPRLRCLFCRQPLSTGALCSRGRIPCQVPVAARHAPTRRRSHGATAPQRSRRAGRACPASRARAAADDQLEPRQRLVELVVEQHVLVARQARAPPRRGPPPGGACDRLLTLGGTATQPALQLGLVGRQDEDGQGLPREGRRELLRRPARRCRRPRSPRPASVSSTVARSVP